MNFFFRKDTRTTGVVAERIAENFLRRNGHRICAKNVVRKTGEIDLITTREGVLHIVEVKSAVVQEFLTDDVYDPVIHIHAEKIRRIIRTAEWYVANIGWKGEWQVDAVLVRIRATDSAEQVRYIPQIV